MPTPAQRLTGDLAQTSVGATGAETQILGLMEWSIDWKKKTVDSTTTDDAGHETAIGSTDSWTAKAKYAYIDGDTSQATNILAAAQNPATPLKWNFFSTVETGRDAWTGIGIIDGITITSGIGKIVGLDVSLKGSGPLVKAAQTAPTGTQAEV